MDEHVLATTIPSDEAEALVAAVLESTLSTSRTCGPLWPGPTCISRVPPGCTALIPLWVSTLPCRKASPDPSFGDSPEMATGLVDLVVAGIKRATASLARDYGDGREPIPWARRFRHDPRRRGASAVYLADHRGDDQAAHRAWTARSLGTMVKGTVHETGGSMPIAAISLDKRAWLDSSSATISSPCSSASRSFGRSIFGDSSPGQKSSRTAT
jgi:hypothetical protein